MGAKFLGSGTWSSVEAGTVPEGLDVISFEMGLAIVGRAVGSEAGDCERLFAVACLLAGWLAGWLAGDSWQNWLVKGQINLIDWTGEG